jgi:hypothetical protein
MSRTARLIGTTLVGVALVSGASQARADGPFQFNSLNPCRVLDTRCPNNAPNCGVANAPAKPNIAGAYNFRLQGACGVPTGAKAVTINLTVVGPSHAGNMAVYPSNLPPPTQPGGVAVSTINFAALEPALANGAIVPLAQTAAPNPDLAVFLNMAAVVNTATAHFIIDVTGYFQ